jgi:hypothetical protein
MKTSPFKSTRNLLTVLGFALVLPVMNAQASDLRMTVEQPRFTCAGAHSALSRVAFHPNDATRTAPLPCCNGELGCAQFLSTNTIVRQTHEWHG